MPFFDPIRIGASGAADAYTVDRSLRFDDDQSSPSRLQRTIQSGGNKNKWTLSVWVKRSQLGDPDYSNSLGGNDGMTIIHATGNGNRGLIKFKSDNTIAFEQGTDGGYSAGRIHTNAQFRDVSAWYHLCFVADYANSTTADRGKIFVNGVRQEVTTTVNFLDGSASDDCIINRDRNHELGFAEYGLGYTGSSNWFNFFCGYMAEFYFIDGQAYDPTYFTETNATTGQLVPKEYTGSFGTTGWYLDFLDNSAVTATTLGKDSSGNSNNWTPNGFSVSAGAGNDSLEDTPTNNFCTLNSISLGQGNEQRATISNGSLDFTESSSSNRTAVSTFGLKTGKWYFEFLSTNTGTFSIGWYDLPSEGGSFYRNNGSYSSSFGGGGTSGYASWTTNDIVGVAIDFDSGKIWYAKNNSWQSGDPATGNSPTNTFTTGKTLFVEAFTDNSSGTKSGSFNFGQRPFTYTAPTGYQSICSANLPDPTILLPNKHFDIVLYSGDGNSTRTFSNVLEFQPDFLWTKIRNAAYAHLLYDSVRGAGQLKSLASQTANAEGAELDNTTYGYLNSFDASGFSVTKGSASTNFFNESGKNYVVWNWNAGNTDGKTYTVKVVSDSGNKYRFDDFGTSAVTLDLAEGGTYVFDWSDSSAQSHPIRFSTTSDGTHGGGSEYTTGVTKDDSAYKTTITVAASAPQLYYYCQYHSGMGGAVNTNSTLGSSNFDGTLQSTVKVNPTAGFSIVSYTVGNFSGMTMGHGLGVAPVLAISKKRSGSSDWSVQFVNPFDNSTDYMFLNKQDAKGDTSTYFTSTTVKDGFGTGANGDTIIQYVFSEVQGYSKLGKYIGNGSATNAPFVFTGFRPRFMIIKQLGQMDWVIDDTTRSTFNESNATLFTNLADAEYTGGAYGIDFYSNGFRPFNTYDQYNGSGDNYIYLAFAESPFKNARAR